LKSPVKDVFISENGYYVISDETFSHYDADGNEKARLRYDGEKMLEKYGNFLFFSGDDGLLSGNYIQNVVNYNSLSSYYQNKLMPLAVTDKGVIIFNEDYKIKNWFTIQQVFYPEVEAKVNKLFRSYTYTKENNRDEIFDFIYLIDDKGNNNGTLKIKKPISTMKEFLYFKTNNTFTLIPKSLL
jgi:hypothetical protein